MILLVEDNPDHAELVVRALANHRVANHIRRVSDGQAALDYLFRHGEYADPQRSPRPHVVLLDLGLPKVDGLEVLKAIRNSEGLSHVPVVVLTASEAETDAAGAREHHANSYLIKPTDGAQFAALVDELGFMVAGVEALPPVVRRVMAWEKACFSMLQRTHTDSHA